MSGWSTTAPYGTYTFKGSDGNTYTANNDVWGASPGPQTIKVISNNDWSVTSAQTFSTDSWVQSFPHLGWSGGKPLSQYPQIVATSAEKGPGYSSAMKWEAAFDVWLNSSPGADHGYEIMVWTDVSGVAPGPQQIAAPTIMGTKYRVYQGAGGNGPCTWLVREGNAPSCTTHLKAIISWVTQTFKGGNYSGPANPTVDTIEFGWEIWGTGGQPANFSCSHYSLDMT
jgi:hypothetical protein